MVQKKTGKSWDKLPSSTGATAGFLVAMNSIDAAMDLQ